MATLDPTNVGATAPTPVDDGVLTTPLPTTIATDAVVGVTTVVGTNNDGQEWTNVRTIVTTSVFATPASTTGRPVFTDPPEAVSPSSRNHNTSLSAGAVAGIAIGTCIAGALIAFLAAWQLFKRRDKKFVQKTCPSGYPIYGDSSPELVMVQKSAATGGPYVQIAQTHMRTPIPAPSRVSATGDPLAGIVPPSASEAEVQNRVAALFEQVQRHVDTFYRDVHASITPSMDSDLASFGKDVNMLELLQTCSQPTVALKHALVAFILSITSPTQATDGQPLWPAELTKMLQFNTSNTPHLAAAQSLHRRLTIHLYTSLNPPSHRLSTLSLPRKTSSAILSAAEHFSLTFFPWANPALSEQEREADLAHIITEALECVIWMGGQREEWGFEWEECGRGVVVLWPGLVVRDGGPRRVVLGQRVGGV
ncbi:hypothetical protein SVAN01_05234 [Stagonosporopsis vannaccii]|nr:hypothetical protein SVAN01_05234 [Stagonosporopsis vannaccii]